jgi:hypothetical protein
MLSKDFGECIMTVAVQGSTRGLTNAKLVKQIAIEKRKIEKKYNSLVVEVKIMIDDAERRTVKENLARTNDITFSC